MQYFSKFFQPNLKRTVPIALLTLYYQFNKQEWLNEEQQRIKKTILVLGPTGTGKSTLCNCLCDKDNYFKSSSKYRSQTKEIQEYTKEVQTNDNVAIELKVIDTPGLFDSERNNGEIIDEITNIIKTQSVDHIVLLLQYSLRAKPSDQMLLSSIKYCIPLTTNNFSVIVNFVFPTQSFNFEKGAVLENYENGEDYLSYIKNLFSQANLQQIYMKESDQQMNEFKRIKDQLVNIVAHSNLDNSAVQPWSKKMNQFYERDFQKMMNEYRNEVDILKEQKNQMKEQYDLKRKSMNGTALGTIAVGLASVFKYTFRGALLISTPMALYVTNFLNVLEPEQIKIEELTLQINQKEFFIKDKLINRVIDQKFISPELQFFLDFGNYNKNINNK